MCSDENSPAVMPPENLRSRRMRPAAGFLSKLKGIDKDLYAVWNGSRWEIWRHRKQCVDYGMFLVLKDVPYRVLVVEEKGEYTPLDNRTIVKLCEMDGHRRNQVKRIREMEAINSHRKKHDWEEKKGLLHDEAGKYVKDGEDRHERATTLSMHTGKGGV